MLLGGGIWESFDLIPVDVINRIKIESIPILICFSADWVLRREIDKCEKAGVRYKGIGMRANTPVGIPRPQGFCVPYTFLDQGFYECSALTYKMLLSGGAASHFDLGDFGNLWQVLLMTRKTQGAICEFGIYKGASALFILNSLLAIGDGREYLGVDTFEGFNYDEARKSPDALWESSHGDTSYESVSHLLSLSKREFGLIKGNVFSMSPDQLPELISVANIDVDLPEAIVAAAELVYPKMTSGGVIIFEDYGHTPELGGAQLAIDKWLKEKGIFRKLYADSGQMLVFIN